MTVPLPSACWSYPAGLPPALHPQKSSRLRAHPLLPRLKFPKTLKEGGWLLGIHAFMVQLVGFLEETALGIAEAERRIGRLVLLRAIANRCPAYAVATSSSAQSPCGEFNVRTMPRR